ncbi:PGC-1 and ERR-induced regulator in muscle protein 1 [Latimeria chalumnae]|uniref:PGC-1 and ERR-induced regulator in muscle protein 1 n=1 Tax=Latimeria chalumnae TaxID=7897 RepID=UPI0003C16C37|nr:PREDICTED: PGC-1 and ERR-induced regulator in muscle protein 1 isoform X2 [Latimeria chalumnae]|eukprot:XP_005986051.1 PREDICTED: PGC-1 and ERR-induced regulator in muscle protein 1 isoform X2 [Latimeria chalumnae]
MDDVEYSVQLSDKDWEEFFTESEECNLTQPSLAVAEDLCQSEIEQSNTVFIKKRSRKMEKIRIKMCSMEGGMYTIKTPSSMVRTSELNMYPKDDCIWTGSTYEDALSGSEDDMDIESVSKFLCEKVAFISCERRSSNQQTSFLVHAQENLDSFCQEDSDNSSSQVIIEKCGSDKEDADIPLMGKSHVSEYLDVNVFADDQDSEDGDLIKGNQCSSEVMCHVSGKVAKTNYMQNVEIKSKVSELGNTDLDTELEYSNTNNRYAVPESSTSNSFPQHQENSMEQTAVHRGMNSTHLPGITEPMGNNPVEHLATKFSSAPNSQTYSLVWESMSNKFLGTFSKISGWKGPTHPENSSDQSDILCTTDFSCFNQLQSGNMELNLDNGSRSTTSVKSGHLKESKEAQSSLYKSQLPDNNINQDINNDISIQNVVVMPKSDKNINTMTFNVNAMEGIRMNLCRAMAEQKANSAMQAHLFKAKDVGSGSAMQGIDIINLTRQHCILEPKDLHCSVSEPTINKEIQLSEQDTSCYSCLELNNKHMHTISIPEMYEYFFSEDQEENDLLPIEIRNAENTSPTSDMTLKLKDPDQCTITVPEIYEFFFGDSEQETNSQREKESVIENSSLTEHSCIDLNHEPHLNQISAISVPEVYEYFFIERSGERDTHFLFSIPSSRARSVLTGIKSVLQRHLHSVNAKMCQSKWKENVGSICIRKRNKKERDHHFQLTDFNYSGLNYKNIEELRNGPEDTNMAMAVRRTQHCHMSLDQADMCLVCIAFASWALKSANVQTQDTWKTALLANIGTISAIRYFRRCIGGGSLKKQ